MTDLFVYITERIRWKRSAGRNSTADLYRASGNWLKKFCGKEYLSIKQLNASMVNDFENYLKNQTLKPNTITSYLSSLKAVYNTACRDGLVSPPQHPFAGLKLKPEKTLKSAIPVDVMEQIACLKLEEEPELEQAADLNTFGFMACGMPFADIARLKKENIQGGTIVYNRRKTGTQVCIHITKGMQMLIDKYQSDTLPFLFPVLDNEETGHETYKRLLRKQNKLMKLIATTYNIPYKITTYTLRRTWACEARRKHIPIEIISMALGHTSEKTTRFYLEAIDISELQLANDEIVKNVNNLVTGEKRTLFT